MRRQTKFALLWILSTGLVSGAATVSGQTTCYLVGLQKPPKWISAAASQEDQQRVVVVDPFQNKLISYDRRTGKGDMLPDLKVAKEFAPTALSREGDSGFLLELVDGALARLDKDLAWGGKPLSWSYEKDAKGFRVGSFYQWKVAGGSVVAYGALTNDSQLSLGFFRLPLDGKSRRPEMLTPLADSDFYLVGNTYIATIGDTAFYVAMGQHPAIYKVEPGRRPEKLAAFPAALSTTPAFKTRMTGPQSAVAHFAELESMTVASGLFAQDGVLYVLGRRAEGGRTSWLLFPIDPEKDKVIVPEGIKLPTSANHLTVVPSKSAWQLIERGPVLAKQEQKIDHMVVIESPQGLASLLRLPGSCPLK